MKIALYTLFFTCWTCLTFGQMANNQKMIELGKAYSDFMFRNKPTKTVLSELKSDVPENLNRATEFILQSITANNKILTQPFLSRPNDEVLKQIYIIRAINLNLDKESQIDNNQLIDSLSNKDIPTYVLVDNYYDMVFTSVGNKNQPFDLRKTDFRMKDYNLKDDTERGIMFLRCMEVCGKSIWGYMVSAPPTTYFPPDSSPLALRANCKACPPSKHSGFRS